MNYTFKSRKCQIHLTKKNKSSILDKREEKGGDIMLYNLKEIRQKRGLTQEKLSQMAKVTRATIAKIENGEEVEVKIGTLEALALALNCKVSDLLCA